MKIRRLILILPVLILTISVIFLSGCVDELDYLMENVSDLGWSEVEYEFSEQTRENLDEAISEAEEQMKKEEEDTLETEVVEGFEEEEGILPNEPVIYKGGLEGVNIELIINFKTTKVSGTLSQSGDSYVDAAIDGTIDIETFYVKATFSGIAGMKSYNREESLNGTITGVITDNLGAFAGKILTDEGDGGDFAAYSKYQ